MTSCLPTTGSWGRVDQYLSHHMASPWSNELTQWGLRTPYDTWLCLGHHDTRSNYMACPATPIWHFVRPQKEPWQNVRHFKDRAHLSTFKIFIFEKFSCFIVLVVFLVVVQSSELISVWFCEKMTFFPNFLVNTSLRYMWAGLPWGCRSLAG